MGKGEGKKGQCLSEQNTVTVSYDSGNLIKAAMTILETTHCSSALELLEAVSPLTGGQFSSNAFVFRGQSDWSYELLPSAHRVHNGVSAASLFGKKDVSNRQQMEFEARMLEKFLKGCDESGLIIPGDTKEMRDAISFSADYRFNTECWPYDNLQQIQALAQHNGVPTCLLDWSRRSYVAAYFAAAGAIRKDMEKSKGKLLCIYALHTGSMANWDNLSLIELPGSTSSNLAAQAGLFTKSITQIRGLADSIFDPKTLGEMKEVQLYRFTLSIEHAADLIIACQKLGVSAATLFPGYGGVAKGVEDWALAKRKPYDPNVLTYRDL